MDTRFNTGYLIRWQEGYVPSFPWAPKAQRTSKRHEVSSSPAGTPARLPRPKLSRESESAAILLACRPLSSLPRLHMQNPYTPQSLSPSMSIIPCTHDPPAEPMPAVPHPCPPYLIRWAAPGQLSLDPPPSPTCSSWRCFPVTSRPLRSVNLARNNLCRQRISSPRARTRPSWTRRNKPRSR